RPGQYVLILSFVPEANNLVPARLRRAVAVEEPILEIVDRPLPMERFKGESNVRPSHIELKHDDSFRLKFSAYNTTFYLHLMPNLEILHHEATISIGNTADDVKALQRADFHIYKGVVLPAAVSDRQLMLADMGVANNLWQDEIDSLGWARMVVRKDIEHNLTHPIFEGVYAVNDDVYHIKFVQNFHMTKRSDDHTPKDVVTSMVIYKDSDTEATEKRSWRRINGECAADELVFNQIQSHQPPFTGFNKRSLHNPLHKNQAGLYSASQLASPHPQLQTRQLLGCPSSKLSNDICQKLPTWVLVTADCTYTKFYRSTSNAMYQIFNDWNTASQVYESTFNISLGIIELQLMPSNCPATPPSNATWNRPCSSDYPINLRLSDFSQWRGKKGDDGAGLWHLMTTCSTGTKVGIAWLGQLCTVDVSVQQEGGTSEFVSGTGVSSITREEWKVVAHEIGHGFGAIHDCTASTCPCQGDCGCCPLSSTVCNAGSTYLMSPTSNVTTKQFSPCSQSYICNSMFSIGYCLRPPGFVNTKSAPICGNGIKEEGEDCDSGGVDDRCCNGKTCKFKSGAICDDANDACCLNCKLKTSGSICRPARSDCDIPEYCTGDSARCPSDLHLPNGVPCGNSTTLKCASGQCTSRDLQCQLRSGRMNITQACNYNQNTCQLNCLDPTDSSQCIILTGMFLNGTQCGYGGFCGAGSCSNSSITTVATNWVDSHKGIAIPLFIGLSLLLLFIIVRLAVYQTRQYQRKRILEKTKQYAAKNGNLTDVNDLSDLDSHKGYYRGDDEREGNTFEMNYWKRGNDVHNK
ncbi:hypothetical protein INT43_004881, partial [Umbelopsis isabellina]